MLYPDIDAAYELILEIFKKSIKCCYLFEKNLGFQNEDLQIKTHIFGYIKGEKQDNPAPRRDFNKKCFGVDLRNPQFCVS